MWRFEFQHLSIISHISSGSSAVFRLGLLGFFAWDMASIACTSLISWNGILPVNIWGFVSFCIPSVESAPTSNHVIPNAYTSVSAVCFPFPPYVSGKRSSGACHRSDPPPVHDPVRDACNASTLDNPKSAMRGFPSSSTRMLSWIHVKLHSAISV